MTPAQAVLRGALAGIVFVGPATLVGGLLAGDDGRVPDRVAAIIAIVTIFGFTLAGYAARRYDPDAVATECALAAVVAWALVQFVGLSVAIARGHDVRPLTLVATALLAAVLGVVGGAVTSTLPHGPDR